MAHRIEQFEDLASAILNQAETLLYIKYQDHVSKYIAERVTHAERKQGSKMEEIEHDRKVREIVKDYILRMCWYLYVCNQTVYAIQYQEQPDIDFKHDWKVKSCDATPAETIRLAGSIDYNLATNDGNMIIPEGYYKTFQWIINSCYREIGRDAVYA